MTARNLLLRPAASAKWEYRTSDRLYPAHSRVVRTPARLPESGRARDDLRPGIRIISFERRVVIAYMILPSGDVEIGRFFYGGRDFEAIIRREDDESV